MRTMIRSRVTFATIEAAATEIATASPFLIASDGHGIRGTGKPSVSAYSGVGSSARMHRRRSARLERWSPRLVDRGRARPWRRRSAATATIRAYADFPLVPRQELRVVDPLGVEPVRQHDRRRHQRAGQRPAAGFVGARDTCESLLAQGTFVADQVAGQSIPPILPRGHAITNASPITFSSGM